MERTQFWRGRSFGAKAKKAKRHNRKGVLKGPQEGDGYSAINGRPLWRRKITPIEPFSQDRKTFLFCETNKGAKRQHAKPVGVRGKSLSGTGTRSFITHVQGRILSGRVPFL